MQFYLQKFEIKNESVQLIFEVDKKPNVKKQNKSQDTEKHPCSNHDNQSVRARCNTYV